VADADRTKWEARYRAGAHDATEPVPLLAKALRHAPHGGRALDLACGRGRHAIALARAGYDVDAVDISPTALASGRERAGDLPIRWIEADLDDFPLDEAAYAVVVWVGFTDEALVERVLAALRPGGVLVYAGRPRALCHYGPRPGDVARWFAPLETLVLREEEDRVRYAGRKTA
jgi:SAM-dependent methyltransferase